MGVYKWKESARFSADVQAIGEELESIETRNPEQIVAFAEDESTELHKCFTWDDARAAHFYRLREARKIVQSVIVVDESEDRKPIEYRAFESVVIDDQRQYIPTKTALSNEDTRKQIFADIGASIKEARNKVKTYKYLAENELDTAQNHLDLANEAVEEARKRELVEV